MSHPTLCIAPIADARDCSEPVLPGTPVPLCAHHVRATYEFAQDIVNDGWTDHIRTYLGALAPKAKPVLLEEPGADERLRTANEQRRQGLVYFIRTDTRIKIGFTQNLEQRMRHLMPDEILHTEPGTRADEGRCHALFADLRVRGEWFQGEQRLLDFIADLKKKATATT